MPMDRKFAFFLFTIAIFFQIQEEEACLLNPKWVSRFRYVCQGGFSIGITIGSNINSKSRGAQSNNCMAHAQKTTKGEITNPWLMNDKSNGIAKMLNYENNSPSFIPKPVRRVRVCLCLHLSSMKNRKTQWVCKTHCPGAGGMSSRATGFRAAR